MTKKEKFSLPLFICIQKEKEQNSIYFALIGQNSIKNHIISIPYRGYSEYQVGGVYAFPIKEQREDLQNKFSESLHKRGLKFLWDSGWDIEGLNKRNIEENWARQEKMSRYRGTLWADVQYIIDGDGWHRKCYLSKDVGFFLHLFLKSCGIDEEQMKSMGVVFRRGRDNGAEGTYFYYGYTWSLPMLHQLEQMGSEKIKKIASELNSQIFGRERVFLKLTADEITFAVYH